MVRKQRDLGKRNRFGLGIDQKAGQAERIRGVQNIGERLQLVDLGQIEQTQAAIVVSEGGDPRLAVGESDLGEFHEDDFLFPAKITRPAASRN